ncbi:MAG: carbonic anhydrase [Phenylobacterium sp.]
MCLDCTAAALSRRGFFGLAAAAGLGVGAARASASHGAKTELTAGQAIERLKQGNARFVADAQLCAADLGRRRGEVAAGQSPWATIVSCSDSRAPPELVFGGLGLGEVFVARDAGAVVDAAELGTLEYGAEELGTPLIVVLGQQRCGAVSAACEIVTRQATFPGSIGAMVAPIVPAAEAVRQAPGDFVTNTVKESARRTAAGLTERSPLLAGLVREGRLSIVSAYYELDSGKVAFAA